MIYTPGPWVLDDSNLYVDPRENYWDGLRIEDKNGVVVIGGEDSPYGQNHEDINLIAAAPDLYEALSELMGYSDDFYPADCEMAKAAIAKARGE